MPMKMKKYTGFKKLKKRIKNLDTELYSMRESLIVGIIKRTQSGKDVDKKSFKPYSKSYKKSGKVDLTVTGNMLHGISTAKIKNGVKLFYTGSEKKKAQGNQASRNFFGIDKDQQILIARRLAKKLTKCK